MALTRAAKESIEARYSEGLAAAPHAFLVSFQGITVNQDTELRSKVRESGGSYAVVKNRVVKRAIAGTPLADLEEHFVGPTAVAYSNDDPVALAKALTDFAKEVPVVEFKAGLLAGTAVDGAQIKDIANLPSREELLAKLAYLLQSPIARLARGLGAMPTRFVTVLDQIRQKKEEG